MHLQAVFKLLWVEINILTAWKPPLLSLLWRIWSLRRLFEIFLDLFHTCLDLDCRFLKKRNIYLLCLAFLWFKAALLLNTVFFFAFKADRFFRIRCFSAFSLFFNHNFTRPICVFDCSRSWKNESVFMGKLTFSPPWQARVAACHRRAGAMMSWRVLFSFQRHELF